MTGDFTGICPVSRAGRSTTEPDRLPVEDLTDDRDTLFLPAFETDCRFAITPLGKAELDEHKSFLATLHSTPWPRCQSILWHSAPQ